jgi:N-dimethylarginine dimethylaminohydrolase
MIQLNVQNETDPLEAVLLGIADSVGPVPTIEEAYDPKSKESIRNGVYPIEKDMVKELDAFAAVFEKYDVELYRPKVLQDVNQIFSRDIAFVVNDFIVVANVLEARSEEIHAIDHVLDDIPEEKILRLQDHVRIEGGDVMPWNGFLFVGYSEPEDFEKYKVSRTNIEGVQFLKNHFSDLEVRAFELVKSDNDPMANALHLDCCFQPIGKDQAIMYKGGFKNQKDVDFLESYFGKENIIEIDSKEMYLMYSNVFSLSPEVIVSERSFTRLNNELRDRGFRVEEVPFFEISKQEGLLRCATLPLRRTH